MAFQQARERSRVCVRGEASDTKEMKNGKIQHSHTHRDISLTYHVIVCGLKGGQDVTQKLVKTAFICLCKKIFTLDNFQEHLNYYAFQLLLDFEILNPNKSVPVRNYAQHKIHPTQLTRHQDISLPVVAIHFCIRK